MNISALQYRCFTVLTLNRVQPTKREREEERSRRVIQEHSQPIYHLDNRRLKDFLSFPGMGTNFTDPRTGRQGELLEKKLRGNNRSRLIWAGLKPLSLGAQRGDESRVPEGPS